MANPLRILILEDSQADAELMERELRQGGLTLVSRVVATEAAFAAALQDFAPDLVLADYALHGFTGEAALRLVRARHSDLPVIIVTGSLGDEVAVDLLKGGASDYVLKDRLTRLAPAVRRSLKEAHDRAQLKQAQASLEAKVAELERFKEVTVGREQRMIELKKEVNGLNRALGRPEPYDLTFEHPEAA